MRQYIAGCDRCSWMKNPLKTKREPMQISGAGVPMERIATNILCQLPETENSNRHILVVSDYLTKWTEAVDMID